MRILVEILHPAHVHFFRNAIIEWLARGDSVLVLSREKDVANELLRAYNIPFQCISRLGPSKWNLLGEMIVRDVRMLKAARRFQPDVLVGIMGVTIVQVAKVIGKPALVFYDTENARTTNRFVYPLAHSVCTPQSYSAPVRGHHIRYPSYHELAYLHPARFTPDRAVLRRHGLDPGADFFMLRFVSWQASHDVGEKGFDESNKRELITLLNKYGRVLISSETKLPPDLEELRFDAPAHEIHHFLAFARLMVGESATMASEAAVLGTPAFYIADTGRGYTDELEHRFGLVWNYKRSAVNEAFEQIELILSDTEQQRNFQLKHKNMLNERIDATTWMMNYIDSVIQGA